MTQPRDPEVEIVRLQCVISDAIAAMDGGCYGDARRILRTGKAPSVIPITSVKARDAG